MAATNPTRQESDALASLEERILRAVQLVSQLRSEKEAAEQDAASRAAEIDEVKAENARLSEELNELREERREVRSRIEKLLGQMDSLAG